MMKSAAHLGSNMQQAELNTRAWAFAMRNLPAKAGTPHHSGGLIAGGRFWSFQQFFSLGLEFVEFGPEFFFGFLVHSVDKQNAMQMIGFMLDGTSQKAPATKLEGLSFLFHSFHM